jgi:hypothetical protein
MTGLVLALAGLTCGDGGPGTGAAHAPLTINLEGEWEGSCSTWDTAPFPILVRGGRVHVWKERGLQPLTWTVAARVDGKAAWRWEPAPPCPGICKLERGHLYICCHVHPKGPRPASFWVGPTHILFVLKPASPRKH